MALTLDLNAIEYRDLDTIVNELEKANVDEVLRLMRPTILSWDYPIALSDKKAFDKLEFDQPWDLARGVMEAFNKTITEVSAEVVVDFKAANWSHAKNKEFMKARSEGKFSVVEKMLREVCSLAADDVEKPLRAVNGGAMMRAWTEAYKKAVSGKN